MELVVEARSLVKRLGTKTLIDNLQFEIRKSDVFGLYGPSGSGKSALLKLLYCNSSVSSGDLYILGLNASENPSKVKSRIGVAPQEESLDSDFDVLENLLIFSSYHGFDPNKIKPYARELLRDLNLDKFINEPIESLSHVERKKLVIARSLINKPDIIFLDEPTSGLPPSEKRNVWSFLKGLKEKGMTIILSSSDPTEVEDVCNEVMILDSGQCLEQGCPKEIIKSIVGDEVVDIKINNNEIDYYIKKVSSNYKYQVVNSGLRLFLENNQDHKDILNDVYGHHVSVRAANLEDVYLKLTGSEFWKKDRRS